MPALNAIKENKNVLIEVRIEIMNFPVEEFSFKTNQSEEVLSVWHHIQRGNRHSHREGEGFDTYINTY